MGVQPEDETVPRPGADISIHAIIYTFLGHMGKISSYHSSILSICGWSVTTSGKGFSTHDMQGSVIDEPYGRPGYL